MNFIDIGVGILLIYGIFKGFSNGAIKEILGLVGLIVAVWAGFRLAFLFADMYKNNTHIPENTVPYLAFLTAFGLALLAVFLLIRVLTKAAAVVQLTLVNKVIGGAFGGMKWAFLIGTLLNISGSSKVIPADQTDGSFTYPHLKTYTEKVNEYTVAMIPAARNVFIDMDSYFLGLDSLRKARTAAPPVKEGLTPPPKGTFPETDGPGH